MKDEYVVAGYVAEIGNKRHDQGVAALFAAQIPAEKGKIGEHRRSCPDAGVEVGAAGGLYPGAAAEQRETQFSQRPLQQQQSETDADGQNQGLVEDAVELGLILPPLCLCRQAGGTHTQETKCPVDVLEENRSQCYSGQEPDVRQGAPGGRHRSVRPAGR